MPNPSHPAPLTAAYLVLVVRVLSLQSVHTQEVLGHPDGGQVQEHTEVAGQPESTRVQHSIAIHQDDLWPEPLLQFTKAG